MPLAKRTDIIDQILAMALHPASDCDTAIMTASIILNIAQSPEAHTYVAWKEVMEKMLETCELKQKMLNELSQQGKKEDPMNINALK